MSHPVEALPEDIARLLEREKNAYPVDPDVRRAMLARVERTIALGGLGGGGPSAPPGAAGSGHALASVVKKGVAGKMAAVAVAAFIGGGVTGGAVVAKMTSTRTLVPVVAPMPPVMSSSAPPSAPAPEATASASPPQEPAPPFPPARGIETTRQGSSIETTRQGSSIETTRQGSSIETTRQGGAPSNHGDLVREREILDAARAALARGQAQDAIVAMEEHARRWPNGELAAEREVVLIQALVAAGRMPEARARAAHFHQSFPKSIFAPAVDLAIGTAPATP